MPVKKDSDLTPSNLYPFFPPFSSLLRSMLIAMSNWTYYWEDHIKWTKQHDSYSTWSLSLGKFTTSKLKSLHNCNFHSKDSVKIHWNLLHFVPGVVSMWVYLHNKHLQSFFYSDNSFYAWMCFYRCISFTHCTNMLHRWIPNHSPISELTFLVGCLRAPRGSCTFKSRNRLAKGPGRLHRAPQLQGAWVTG